MPGMTVNCASEACESGLECIRELSERIGPRAPCSPEEKGAATCIAERLSGLGLEPEIEEFASTRSFGAVYLAIFATALGGGFLQGVRGLRVVGHLAAAVGAATAVLEGRFHPGGVASLLRRERSVNVHASIEPSGAVERTVCLVSHMDSSRAGLMFHPRVVAHLGALVSAAGFSALLQVISGPLMRVRRLRPLVLVSRGLVALGLGLIVEREVRGSDVPGANDNASGVGACVALAETLVGSPLKRARVVILVTGSEESGALGMREFLSRHNTGGWWFVNFDGVGADAPLRVLSKEGGPLSAVDADPELLELARQVGAEDPELLASPLAHGSGLPYDSTPVLVRGGRAISVVNQEGAIPDYHWPTDRMDRISPEAFSRAVRFGRKLVEKLDSR